MLSLPGVSWEYEGSKYCWKKTAFAGYAGKKKNSAIALHKYKLKIFKAVFRGQKRY